MTFFKFLLLLLSSNFPSILAAPLVERQANSTCTSKLQRKSWTDMADDEKSAYISAELCLMNSPAKSNAPGAQSRWDDLQYLHIVQTDFIHDVGQFLPWHRYFVKTHETLLREECNYTGAQPYWDEAADQASGTFPDLDIFDPDTGFGGNGVGDSNCITDGPFVNLTLHIQKDGGVGEYCLSRSFSENAFSLAAQAQIDACVSSDDYATAWPCYFGNLHNAGHGAVGGVMIDVARSPGDPLFHMHHTNLDRLWWEWQQANLTARLTEISGNNVPDDSYLQSQNLTAPSTALTEYDGDPGNVTTLNHVLWMNGVLPNVTVADVMDLGGDVICAEYV